MDVRHRLVDAIASMARAHDRVAVAVDGPDAAGKTTLADDLATRLAVSPVRASLDDWHRPRVERTARGQLSPEGYYLDSFDHEALTRELVRPFLAGAPEVRTAAFDHRMDTALVRQERVAARAVLLVDGVFLLRPELADLWTLSIHLHVPAAVTLERAVVRDRDLFGSEQAVRLRYAQRYLPGQALYRQQARPRERADVLLDNSDPHTPVLLCWRLALSGSEC